MDSRVCCIRKQHGDRSCSSDIACSGQCHRSKVNLAVNATLCRASHTSIPIAYQARGNRRTSGEFCVLVDGACAGYYRASLIHVSLYSVV